MRKTKDKKRPDYTDRPTFVDTHMQARKKSDDKESSALWRIMSINEDGIALSGPGPCRAYQIVDHDTFDQDWDVIWCRSPSGHENKDAHMLYARHTDGKTICSFCNRDHQWVRSLR